jgi:peptidoglycan/xylan/chitin deacetylase (PgdA/CDA1 family)
MKVLQSLLFLLSLLLCGSTFAAAQTLVMITVDVESYAKGNPGLQIWGKQPDGEHGIQRMMDMLDAHGLKGTFYLNVYEAAKHGETDIAKVARAIHLRGHDLQLHTHPGPMFGIEYMQQASLDKQVEILKWGKDLIRQWTGKTVVAHRAGGFAANLDTLKACKLAGLQIDSSFSPVSGDTVLAQQLPATNLPHEIEGVVELPITYYAQARLGNWQSLRYLDIEGSSYDEMVDAIRQFRDAGFPVVNIMMHSFSFVRYGKADPGVEQRFDDLLKFLAAEPGVKVITVSQLYPEWTAHIPTLQQGADLVPETGVWLMYRRAWEDLKGWKNILVAVTPPAMLFVVSAITIWWRRKKKNGIQTI